MSSVPQVAHALHSVLNAFAHAAARSCGFVQRKSKMSGALFVQTLTFTWLAKPQASLEELSQTAATLGVQITPQGLDERFSQEAATLLRQVLEEAVRQMIVAAPVGVTLLTRFAGVYLLDSTVVALPDTLATVWQGCGGRVPQGGSAALKVQVCWNLCCGVLQMWLQDGRAQDQSAPTQSLSLPQGALRLSDLGYFALKVLARLGEQGVYWLTRVKVGVHVWDAEGRCLQDLQTWGELLRQQKVQRADLPIQLGAIQRLPCRLLAVRVAQQVAQGRRRQLRQEARRKGHTVSQARLALADWNLFVTNTPQELLSLDEALVLLRARWQVELLFKLWKSHGQIDAWRSHKPWRVLCEVYAKLLALLVQHWLFLVSCWQYPDRSLVKAAQTVQKHALHLAAYFACQRRLCEVVGVIQHCLAAGCRMNTRKNRPNHYQLLLTVPFNGGLA